MPLRDFGDDVGNLVVEIRTLDASGAPTDTVLTSTSIPASQIPAETTTIAVSFDPGAEVVAGQQYALVLSAPEAGGFGWQGLADSNPCPDGQSYFRQGGGPLVSGTIDLFFSALLTPAPDTIAPTVEIVTPTGKNVSPKANVTATFSETMNEASVEAPGTFTLKKSGSTKAIPARVTYDPNTKKATLDPTKKMRSGATYIAKVTTAAKDSAGNTLDQNSGTAGNQPKSWRFKVK